MQGGEDATETAINGTSGTMGLDSVRTLASVTAVCVSHCVKNSPVLFDFNVILRTILVRISGRKGNVSKYVNPSFYVNF